MLKTNEEFIEQQVKEVVSSLQHYCSPQGVFVDIASLLIKSCCLKVLNHSLRLDNEKLLQKLAELNRE
jgi:hypothetical protein